MSTPGSRDERADAVASPFDQRAHAIEIRSEPNSTTPLVTLACGTHCRSTWKTDSTLSITFAVEFGEAGAPLVGGLGFGSMWIRQLLALPIRPPSPFPTRSPNNQPVGRGPSTRALVNQTSS